MAEFLSVVKGKFLTKAKGLLKNRGYFINMLNYKSKSALLKLNRSFKLQLCHLFRCGMSIYSSTNGLRRGADSNSDPFVVENVGDIACSFIDS